MYLCAVKDVIPNRVVGYCGRLVDEARTAIDALKETVSAEDGRPRGSCIRARVLGLIEALLKAL